MDNDTNTNQLPGADSATAMADAWCRMWTAQPALAAELMTDDCTQWSATTPVLDDVVGPLPQERFIAARLEQAAPAFERRLVVSEGDMFAYLWDVTMPDGTVRTGIDVNVVRDGLICENWTFVGDAHRDEPDPEPSGGADRDELQRQAAAWSGGREAQAHRRPIVDTAAGVVARMRTSAGVGGVDLLAVRGGALQPIWTVTGTRAFRY